MKVFSDFNWLAGWQPKAGVFCLLLLLVLGGGCKKSDKAPVSVAPSQETNSTSTPTAAAPTTAPAATATAAPTAAPPPISLQMPTQSKSTNSGPTQLQLLNRAMLAWEMKNHRRPRTFEEFASTAGFQIPDPPTGQKYALNSKGFIILVNANQ